MFALKQMQIVILLFKNGLTIYDLRVPTTTFNFAITFIVSHKSYVLVKRSKLLRVHLQVIGLYELLDPTT